jgi:FtsP/CotA-like multicopper oxidase with cupredoxin domain
MTITHSDGFPVVPFDVDAFVIGMGERYDVTIDVQSGAWPIIALAEGKDARAAAVLRTVDAVATATPDLNSAISELDGVWLRYADLRAAPNAALTLPSELPSRTLKLTGGMGRYDWGIDGRPFGEHTPIEVEQGGWLSLVFENTTTMWHPIHLHGHTPQLGVSPAGARKDTVNVLPGTSVALTFPANNPGEWMLHCHNAYHLEAGMATVLSYTN